MPQTIQHPTLGAVQFPDEMRDDQIASELDRLAAEDAASKQPAEAPAPSSGASPYGLGAKGVQFGEVPPVPQEVQTAALRYGVPIAAGVATGGMAFLPAAAITGAASAGGEAAAQFLENQTTGEPMRPREVAAAGVAGLATPVKIASAPVANFLANAGIGVGATQAAKAIREGEFKAPKDKLTGVIEFGLPVGFAGLGAYATQKATTAKKAAEELATLSAERGGLNVLPGEIVQGYQGMEARLIRAGNQRIINEAQNLDADLGKIVIEAYKDAPRQEELGRKVIPYVKSLDAMKATAQSKREAAQAAEEAFKRAEFEGASNLSELESKARGAAIEAEKSATLYTDGLQKVFGSQLGDVSQYATGARINRIKAASETANNAIKEGLSKLYKLSGIDENTSVVRLDDIRATLAKKVPGAADWVELVQQVEKAAKAPGVMLEDGLITLNGYRRIRDDIAKGLIAQGESPSLASRKASQAYDAIREAHYDFLKETNPDALKALKPANEAAAAVFKAKGSQLGVIDSLASGDIAGVVSAIEKEGYGPVVQEIQGYAQAIAGMGGRDAALAANTFKQNIRLAIRDHIIDTSLRLGAGEDNASKAIDMGKVVERLDSLRQKGLGPEQLGMGSSKDVKALAKIASNQGGSVSVEQFNNFVNDLAELGGDKAASMLRLENLQKAYLAEQNVQRKASLGQYVKDQLAKAKLDAQDAETAFTRASNDPLVVMLNQPGFALTPKGDNTKYVTSVLNGGPEGARGFIKALRTPVVGDAAETASRAKLADDIGKAAVSSLLFDNVKKAMGPGDNRLQLANISDFFEGASNRTQRDAMRELIGAEAFDNLKKTLGDPIVRIHKTQQRLAAGTGDFKENLIAASAATGLAKGRTTGGVVVGGALNRFINAIERNEHNLAYTLYIRPDTAKAFRQASYNVDKFINSSPRNALLYRLAAQEDQKSFEPTP